MFRKISRIIVALTATVSLTVFASDEQSTAELVLTTEEDAALSKWKKNNKTLDDAAEDAFEGGDSAAFCLLAYSYLYGLGDLTIDVAHADKFFSISASLGFAPAIDEIAIAHLSRNPNVCLALVYKNLAISFGHSEMVIAYHQCREIIAKNMGSAVCQEIEKIAARKKGLIFENKKKLSEAKDKMDYLVHLDVLGKLITSEDNSLGNIYWENLSKKPPQLK